MNFEPFSRRLRNTEDEQWLARFTEMLIEVSRRHRVSIHVETTYCSEDNTRGAVYLFLGDKMFSFPYKDGSELLGIFEKIAESDISE